MGAFDDLIPQPPASGPAQRVGYIPGTPKAASVPSGFRATANGNLEYIPGGPADPTAKSEDDPGLDPATTHFYAQQVIAGGQLPAMGMGKAAAKMRQQVMEEVARIGQANGGGGADLATQQAHYKAGLGNITNLERQRGTTQQNEETALANGQQYMDRSTELPLQSTFPVLNSVVQTAQRYLPIPGHETIAAMDTAHNTFVNEYAKVVSGSPSGSGTLSDSARHEAMQTMLGNYSLGQKQAAFAQMKADMDNRLAAMNGTISDAYGNLTKNPRQDVATIPGMTASGGSMPPPPAMGGGAPPAAGGMPPSSGGPSGGLDRGNVMVAPNADQIAPSTDGAQTVVDSKLTPIRRAYMARLGSGQSGPALAAFLQKAGVNDPDLLAAAQAQADFRAKNPRVPISYYDTSAIDHVQQNLGTANQVMNAAGQSGLGAGVIAAGNAASANFLPEIIGATGGNTEQARAAIQYSGQDHPGAALAGTMAGGTMAALSGEAALARGAGMAPGALRSGIADSIYGGGAGAGATPDNRLGGAAWGAAGGALGSFLGQGVAKGASAALRGVTNKDVGYLAKEGIGPLTVGQVLSGSGQVGKIAKGLEDRLTGFSGVGDMINARRAEGVRAMNSKAFDKALEPIGGTVGDAVGEDAVDKARSAVSQAFNKAVAGKSAALDQQFVSQARGPLERLASIKRDGLGEEVVGQIEEATKGYFDANGHLSGEHLQAFLESLRQIRQAYKNDPLGHKIAESVRGIESAATDMFGRQSPEVVPQLNAAKAAYRRLSILAGSVNAAKETNGIFTPAQLGTADRANTKKYEGAMSAASGNSPFQDFQRAAQNVLPSKVADSGTAGRLAMLRTGSLTGVGAGLGYLNGDAKGGAETGLGLTGLLALAYTRTGQRRLASMLMSRSPQTRALAEQITKRLPMAGAAGASLSQTSSGQ